MKATINDGTIKLGGIRLRVSIQDLSPDRPHVVATALEEAYRMGRTDGAEYVAQDVSSRLSAMRCGRE